MKTNSIKLSLLTLCLSALFLSSCEQEAEQTEQSVVIDNPIDSLIQSEAPPQRDTLTGHWVKADFLKSLLQSGNPYGSQEQLLPISELIVNEESGQITLVFAYNESCSGDLIRKGDSLLINSCDGDESQHFVFEYDPFSKQLLLSIDELSLRFERVSKNITEAGKAVQQQLVKQRLHGVFRLQSGDKPLGNSLQFGENGFVKGSSKYNKFRFLLGYGSYPAFNSVLWLYKNAQQYDPYYWELQGDSLILSSFNEEMPDMFEVSAIYVRQ
jgi:hypothetical protein